MPAPVKFWSHTTLKPTVRPSALPPCRDLNSPFSLSLSLSRSFRTDKASSESLPLLFHPPNAVVNGEPGKNELILEAGLFLSSIFKLGSSRGTHEQRQSFSPAPFVDASCKTWSPRRPRLARRRAAGQRHKRGDYDRQERRLRRLREPGQPRAEKVSHSAGSLFG